MLEFDPTILEQLATDHFGAPPTKVTPMPGGASTRRYFRIEQHDPKGLRRAVAMFVPDATPEEVTNAKAASKEWPFLEVQRLLELRTLAAFIAETPHEKEAFYDAAVRDLAPAQKALVDLPDGSIVRTRSLDEKLLGWELDHHREWGRDAIGRPSPTRIEQGSIGSRIASLTGSPPSGAASSTATTKVAT